MKQFLIAVDQLVNCLIYAGPEKKFGMADETISARCWRLEDYSWRWHTARIVVDRLFFFQPRHCEESFNREIDRSQLPAVYSTGVK